MIQYAANSGVRFFVIWNSLEEAEMSLTKGQDQRWSIAPLKAQARFILSNLLNRRGLQAVRPLQLEPQDIEMSLSPGMTFQRQLPSHIQHGF